MKRVVIESPFRAPDWHGVQENIAYAIECVRDSISRNEAPTASHLLYTRALDDSTLAEREQGIACGYAWMAVADLVAVYTDRGHSEGMLAAVRHAAKLGIPVEFRSLCK